MALKPPLNLKARNKCFSQYRNSASVARQSEVIPQSFAGDDSIEQHVPTEAMYQTALGLEDICHPFP